MSTPSFTLHNTIIKFPDTPESRRVVELLKDQHDRLYSKLPISTGLSTHRSLFQAPNQPAAAASANQSTPVQPAQGKSPESVDSSMHPNNLFGHETVPEATAPRASYEFVELNEPVCSAEQLGSIVIDAMLSGTNLIPHHSSDQVFDEAISQASVPKAVAGQKKNSCRCTNVDSLVAHFKVAEPHYVFPTGEDCDELRLCMTKVITQIRKDYKCSAHLEFTGCATHMWYSRTRRQIAQTQNTVPSLLILSEQNRYEIIC